jgi:hypothetical protein
MDIAYKWSIDLKIHRTLDAWDKEMYHYSGKPFLGDINKI